MVFTAARNETIRAGQVYLNSTVISLCVQRVTKVWRIAFEGMSLLRVQNSIALHMQYDEVQAFFLMQSKYSKGFSPSQQRTILRHLLSTLRGAERVD